MAPRIWPGTEASRSNRMAQRMKSQADSTCALEWAESSRWSGSPFHANLEYERL